jgi:asparagine synthase (glutamine-hydrolysing)
MPSRCGRWQISFNGEIYNHQELREELCGPWRGHCDSETLAEAISKWGVRQTLERAVGMFAIAAWDNEGKTLWLARDRMGEKPLYYGRIGDQFRASSELKGLIGGGEKPEIDSGSLALYFRHNYIAAPHTIWQGVRKLPPGHLLEIQQSQWNASPEPEPWWSLDDQIGQRRFEGTEREAIQELDGRLRKAVARQLVSDVPLGAFLSGGIDSSMVVALMQSESSRPVRSFTIGFEETDFDESPAAEQVASHLGTEHVTMRVTAQDALDTIPHLADIWDEPFSDSSQIPTLLLCRLTRQYVTVSLSGDGGDELFAGYRRYRQFERLYEVQHRFPKPLRLAAARVLTALPPAGWDYLARPLKLLTPRARHFSGDRVHNLADLLPASTPDELYRLVVSHWRRPEELIKGAQEPPSALTARGGMGPTSFPSRLQYLDQHSYLPDDILVKVDRAAMAASLETRVPLLDPSVVSFAWMLPTSMTMRSDGGKWILRELLAQYVPRKLFERPKKGFGVPLGDWLRGPLRDWAHDLLDERTMLQQGLLDPKPVHRLLSEHLSGGHNWHHKLWVVLMFQAWYRRWVG